MSVVTVDLALECVGTLGFAAADGKPPELVGLEVDAPPDVVGRDRGPAGLDAEADGGYRFAGSGCVAVSLPGLTEGDRASTPDVGRLFAPGALAAPAAVFIDALRAGGLTGSRLGDTLLASPRELAGAVTSL